MLHKHRSRLGTLPLSSTMNASTMVAPPSDVPPEAVAHVLSFVSIVLDHIEKFFNACVYSNLYLIIQPGSF